MVAKRILLVDDAVPMCGQSSPWQVTMVHSIESGPEVAPDEECNVVVPGKSDGGVGTFLKIDRRQSSPAVCQLFNSSTSNIERLRVHTCGTTSGPKAQSGMSRYALV